MILTFLPKDWSIGKTEGEVPNIIHTAKQLVKKYGIQSSPNPEAGRSLDLEIAYIVEKFRCNDMSAV